MKKIILLLLMLLLLCSCKSEVPADSENISSSESSESMEEIPEEEPKPIEEKDPVETAAIAEIRGMLIYENNDYWSKEGFSAKPGNIAFFEDNIFSYTLNIKSGDTIISIPSKGTLSYNDMDNFSRNNQSNHVLATWGHDGKLSNGIRYFISLGKIVFLDSNFELVGQIFIPENDYYYIWPISVAYDDVMGYIVPVCRIPKDGSKPSGIGLLYLFDENFELDKELGEIPVYYRNFYENYIPAFPVKDSYIYYYDDVPHLSSLLEYNLDNNTAYQLGNGADRFYDGERSVEFIEAKPFVFEDTETEYKSYALLKSGNDVIDYIELPESYWFGPVRNSSVAAIAKNGSKAEVYDEFFHRVFSLNFRKKTVEYEYVFKEEHLGEPFDTTDDKKYSLHAVSYTQGGDGVGFNVVLKNNETGEMNFMFSAGGTNQGFFKNGDIYYQAWDSLKVYSSKTRELLFALEDKFPLNADSEKGDYRVISAFRRDPETLEFMIVYWEGPSDISLYESGKEKIPTYKFAFFDVEGNLIETYDSEISVVLGMYMWPQEAVIYYKDGRYTVTTLGSKGDKGINFTFDYNEKTFSAPKKNK